MHNVYGCECGMKDNNGVPFKPLIDKYPNTFKHCHRCGNGFCFHLECATSYWMTEGGRSYKYFHVIKFLNKKFLYCCATCKHKSGTKDGEDKIDISVTIDDGEDIKECPCGKNPHEEMKYRN